MFLYDLLRGHPRSLENNDLKLKLNHSVSPLTQFLSAPSTPRYTRCCKTLQVQLLYYPRCEWSLVLRFTYSLVSFYAPHIFIDPPSYCRRLGSHGHGSAMIFDLQLGYGQFHGRLSPPTPLPLPGPKTGQVAQLGFFFCFAFSCPSMSDIDLRFGVFGRSWLGYGHLHGWLLLRKPLPPSTAKNSLDRSSRLILRFLARPCSAYVALLVFGRSWLDYMAATSLAGCSAMTCRGGVRASYLAMATPLPGGSWPSMKGGPICPDTPAETCV